jgi:hypothetical protein
MKTFKEIAEQYQEEIVEGAKLKKAKKWVPDDKGNLKRVLKKFCVDSDGQKAAGYKIVGGKKCQKMTPDEIKLKMKTMKKVNKTKKKNASKIAKKAEIIAKKRASKGL